MVYGIVLSHITAKRGSTKRVTRREWRCLHVLIATTSSLWSCSLVLRWHSCQHFVRSRRYFVSLTRGAYASSHSSRCTPSSDFSTDSLTSLLVPAVLISCGWHILFQYLPFHQGVSQRFPGCSRTTPFQVGRAGLSILTNSVFCIPWICLIIFNSNDSILELWWGIQNRITLW